MCTGTSPYVNNFVLISWLLSHFIEKKYFHGNMYKIRELPQHNTLRFFCWWRSLKIHIEIKRVVVYVWKVPFIPFIPPCMSHYSNYTFPLGPCIPHKAPQWGPYTYVKVKSTYYEQYMIVGHNTNVKNNICTTLVASTNDVCQLIN
jgi:hypothetical protein